MTPKQIIGLRNYARQQQGIRHVSITAEQVIELCDELERLKTEAEAAERMRPALQHIFSMIEVELYESEPGSLWHTAASIVRDALTPPHAKGNAP